MKIKRDEITAAIAHYEKALEQARADLSHINAAITIFDASAERMGVAPYMDIHRIFARGETIRLCKEALASGPMNTRQLAVYIIEAKGLDKTDRVLAKAVAARIIHAIRQQERRGLIVRTTMVRGVCVWALP
ncbi:MAG: hypothetical protein KDJ88_05700 [Bauldia sp.]|nr:hypothetical protein [Bauldia sp.]